MNNEIDRIHRLYDTQYRRPPGDYSYVWHARNPVSYTYRQARERAIIKVLNRHSIQLEEAKILDIGCGGGGFLTFLASLGALPGNLHGIDLMEYRIEAARAICPSNAHLSVEDAQHLPFEAQGFEVVSQLTVFSSILDPAVQGNVAAEIDRVLKPGGLVLWYDMKGRHAPTSNTQGIGRARLIELFPRYTCLEWKSLHHRWIPRLARHSWLLCELIEMLPGLPHTHVLALLRKA